ncbi:hypothetical protein [Photobacterium rosenbergii]|uniref:Uncharacterized protein n=1 Tax=Photobacterium rosenbergii TaxID=294936 RepID=A0ABU3ZFQ0_9GAMM|nr:hypothetical protein [Photobacterium rosenbergii]MDV5168872.1 hypothetical protein [Photobacterium rosenbergii]
MSTIPEKDWKVLRNSKEELLAIACDNIFKEVDRIYQNRVDNEHASYLELWQFIQIENNKIGEMFDDLKRSNALFKLVSMRLYGILSDEYLCKFSAEIQHQILELMKYRE